MGSLATRHLLARHRPHVAMVAAVCCLGASIALAHTGMGEMHSSATAVWCLAVIPAVGVAAATAMASRRQHRLAAPRLAASGATAAFPRRPRPSARRGPPPRSVLRL